MVGNSERTAVEQDMGIGAAAEFEFVAVAERWPGRAMYVVGLEGRR